MFSSGSSLAGMFALNCATCGCTMLFAEEKKIAVGVVFVKGWSWLEVRSPQLIYD